MVIWYHGTTEKPVTYLVKLGSRKRLCHMNHLLHTRVISTDDEPDVNDVPDLELTPAQA